MDTKSFLLNKLKLLKKDQQLGFSDIAEPLAKSLEKNANANNIDIKADGNWFKVSLDAVQLDIDRAVISAQRIHDGMVPGRFNSSQREFRVEFQGTRAAYLFGEYHQSHRFGNWPYISWDIRSYANNPQSSNMRVYVSSFRAHNEIRRLVSSMQAYYGTRNVVNSYINDNLKRFKIGVASKKSYEQIEKEWSRGLMESMGYSNVEASVSLNHANDSVKVHWYKDLKDALNVRQ